MFQLVYVSSASRKFNTNELHELLVQARQKNRELGVTGMLLYKDGNFMQVLEGQQEVVSKLAEKIELDPRHKGIIVVLRGMAELPSFPD
jgi:hypothetical protein